MVLVQTNNPTTEIRSQATQAGRGIRVEREQDLAFREQANQRANEQLQLQQSQQAFSQQLQLRQQGFNEQLQLENFELSQTQRAFDNQVKLTQEARFQQDLESLGQRRRDQTQLSENTNVLREQEEEGRQRRSEETDAANIDILARREIEETKRTSLRNSAGIDKEVRQREQRLEDDQAQREREAAERTEEIQSMKQFGNAAVSSGLIDPKFSGTLGASAEIFGPTQFRTVTSMLQQASQNPAVAEDVAKFIEKSRQTDIENELDRLDVMREREAPPEVIEAQQNKILVKQEQAVLASPSWFQGQGTIADFDKRFVGMNRQERYVKLATEQAKRILVLQIAEQEGREDLTLSTLTQEESELLDVDVRQQRNQIISGAERMAVEGGWIVGP